MGGIYSELATEIWARELGFQSEGFVQVAAADVDTRYAVDLYPPTGFQAWIPHKFTFALPLSSERGDLRAAAGSLTTVATTYGTVVSLTVGASPRRDEVMEIALDSDNFSKTNWQLTIGGVQQFTGLTFHRPLTLPFRRGYLASGEVVLLEAASTDGTSIVAKGAIPAREWTPYEWQIWVYKVGLGSEEHTAYITDDIIRDGVGSWVYVTKGEPLHVEVEKSYGRSDDHILIYTWASKVPSLTNLDEIKVLAASRGVREALPTAAPGAVMLPVRGSG